MFRIKQLILAAGDLIMFYGGLYIAVATRYQRLPSADFLNLITPFTALFVLAIVIMFIAGLYDVNQAKNQWSFYQKIGLVAGVWTIIGIAYFYFNAQITVAPKTILLLTTVIGFGLVALWRYLHNRFLSAIIGRTALVFAGFTPEVAELIKRINSEPSRGLNVAGIIETAPPTATMTVPIASTLSGLLKQLPTTPQRVVVAPHFAADPNALKELYSYLFRPIEIVDLAKFYEEIMGRIPPFTFSESWFLSNLREQPKKIYDRFRVLIDYFFGILMGAFFVVTTPLIAVAIKMTSPGPVFFKQERIGRGGRVFMIYKFRTMKSLAKDGSAEISGPQFAAVNDSRITSIGKFLRRTRLDEIPQFINILKGDMGIIGPRPERPAFVATLSGEMPFYTLRHLIKPGLTGWAQIQHSYYGNIAENLYKLEYDLYYIKNRGPLLDLAIVLRTFNTLVRFAGR